MTKAELYVVVAKLRKRMEWAGFTVPYDAKVVCTEGLHLFLDERPIKSKGLRGMSHTPTRTVVLDNRITEIEQNFFCMHECMHHYLHKDLSTKLFQGYQSIQPNQNPITEWQANEGAAEFLVPYQLFIPRYVSLSKELARETFADILVVERLADEYEVSEAVISNRINSLNFEIYNFMQGQDVFSKQFQLISNTKLRQLNWNKSHVKTYCRNCLSVVSQRYHYCACCGNSLYAERLLRRLGATNKGAGYVKYSSIDLDKNSKAKICPICENELILDGDFCHICGIMLINKCSNAESQEIGYNDWTEPCGILLSGDARYCHKCGAESAFFQSKILKDWKLEKDDLPF